MKRTWLLLTHQLPAEPTYVRAKVGRKLQALGAVPIKNSIYVLPDAPGSREDFDWLRKEILQMNGDASIFAGDSVTGLEDKEIIKTFQNARAGDFAGLIDAVEAWKEKIKSALEGGHIKSEPLLRLERQWGEHQAELERLRRIDFFRAPNRAKVEAAASAANAVLRQAKARSVVKSPAPPPPVKVAELKGKIWVTRKSPHIDRLASAWLVRRYVDPKARFKFVAAPYERQSAAEIRFDMAEGEFTHFGDWCTFETLMKRLRLDDPALTQIAEIVHDIDLKDAKFGRHEAAGFAQVVRGLCAVHPEDSKRLEAGLALFDAFYASFSKPK
ncbi:MAG: chromate resistance protein [Elusimicrobia bacterium]|nr:chromate resistance protein [Elusimicrobiota bacterium]